MVEHDARAYSALPYYSAQVCGEGWAIAGDAASFIDPLYSPGLDLCAYTTSIVSDLVVRSLGGEDMTERRRYYNEQFVTTYRLWFETLYQDKYFYMGEADLMSAALLLDVGTYFIGLVRPVYANPERAFLELPFEGAPGRIFAGMMKFYNRRLAALAKNRIAHGAAGAHNAGWRELYDGFVPDFRLHKLIRKGLFRWWRAELRNLRFLFASRKHAPGASAPGGRDRRSLMSRGWWRRFAVRGVVWRHYLDFGLTNVPFYLRPVMIFFWTIFFFFLAAPARRAILSNLRVVLPGSNPLLNLGRAWLTLYNFAWTISDAADHKLAKTEFAYEVEGAEFLEELAAAQGAILLTAHMGNYDLGAAVFAQRFQRDIRMVRAPEADAQTAQASRRIARTRRGGRGQGRLQHLQHGAAVRAPERHPGRARSSPSRAIARSGMSRSARRAFSAKKCMLPDGPFMLAFVAQAPIYPLFIVRT